MRTANEYEIAIFKKEYCKNGEARISIGKDFEVDVESFKNYCLGKLSAVMQRVIVILKILS